MVECGSPCVVSPSQLTEDPVARREQIALQAATHKAHEREVELGVEHGTSWVPGNLVHARPSVFSPLYSYLPAGQSSYKLYISQVFGVSHVISRGYHLASAFARLLVRRCGMEWYSDSKSEQWSHGPQALQNIILATDSYKVSHYKQYPPETEYVYSYFVSAPPPLEAACMLVHG